MCAVFKSKSLLSIAFPTIEETLQFVHTCIYAYNNGTTCVFMCTILVPHGYLGIQ
jgi:hypothetical protein